MAIRKIYLGIWFQRTSIHLREVYRFLKYQKSFEEFDSADIARLWDGLGVRAADYSEEKYLDFIRAKCGDYDLSMSEDGVVLLKTQKVADLKRDMSKIEEFYLKNLGPAISYLFSKGAPLPKEFVNIKETYPLYLVGDNLSEDQITSLFGEFDDDFLSTASTGEIEIYSGERISIINIKHRKYSEPVVEELIQNILFFREFERQLGNYLHLHRVIWEKIRKVRDAENLYYKNVKEARDSILDILETLSFIKTRLRQMRDILEGRAGSLNLITKKELAGLGMERFEMFKADANYMENLWQTTIDYANSTMGLINSVFNENTQRELNALRFITLLGVVVGFFGMNIAFPWEERWGAVSGYSWIVMILIAAIALVSYYILKLFLFNRRFSLHWHKG